MPTFDERRLYFSTVSLSSRLGYWDALETFEDLGIRCVELGYLGDTSIDPVDAVERYDFNFLCHNYFLPHQKPFILNLASNDPAIRQRSIEYVKNCVDFASDHGIGLYTVHGGFRVDPTLDLTFSGEPTPYEEAFALFREAISELSTYAAERSVFLGVENNVVESTNMSEGRNEYLMFCTASEFERLFENIDSCNLGILLDVGHLLVSARTLDYEPSSFTTLEDDVLAFHVHDNDGKRDAHDPVDESSRSVTFIDRHFGDLSVPIVVESRFQDTCNLISTRDALIS